MKITPIFLTVLFLVWMPPSLGAVSDQQATVDAIQQRYETVNTFQAGFVQRAYVKMMNQVQESRGKVQIKKPGRMKWVYDAPDRQILVTNQETLWFYVPEDEQVTKMPIANVYSSNTPALFLAGRGKLTDTFNIAQVIDENQQITVVLIPKTEDHSLNKLVLIANQENYQIMGSTVYDKLGNKTEIQFHDIQVNLEIPESTFQFKIPNGVELMDFTPSGTTP